MIGKWPLIIMHASLAHAVPMGSSFASVGQAVRRLAEPTV